MYKSIKSFNKLIKIGDECKDVYYNRGNAYAKLKNYQRAIEDFEQALKLDPNYNLALLNKGNTY